MDEKFILLIDDDKEFIEVLKLALSKTYKNVHAVSDIETGINLLSQYNFSCIVLDINIAGRNGAEIIKYLVEHQDNLNNTTPVIIMSGYINEQFIEKHSTRFAGILRKPFEKNELTSLIDDTINRTSEENEKVDDTNNEDLPTIKCELPFPVNQLQARVDNILKQVKKTSKLKQLLLSVVDRNSDNYIMAHAGLIINISTAIAIKLEWNTDKTLEKFVFAAYLHNMALKSRPDLARYSSLDNIEAIKEKFSKEDYQLLWNHGDIAAKTIEDYKEIPPEVETIIRQHHELPKGNGFPSHANHKKIIPLSAVFIVSHEFANYIIRNPNWKLEKFIEEFRKKITGAHFHKILKALEDMS